jgi:flagellin
MGFSINNTTSLQSNSYANVNQSNQNKTLDALSSGSKINKAADGAADLAVSDELLALIAATGQGIQNANESIGMLQVADGGLEGIEDNMQKIEQLTIKASNDTLGADDRANIQKEIDGLLKASDSIAEGTRYNGMSLLDGTKSSITTQTGADAGANTSVKLGDAQTEALVGSIDVTTEAGRAAAFDSLAAASDTLSSMRSEIGAGQNQLMSSIQNSSVSQVNAASAASQMADVDFAQESANFSRDNLMSQAGMFAQTQSNASASRVSALLA